MSAGYTNLRTVSYRDTIAELIARANQTHTRATGVQVFSPGDGMAYEDAEGFINPISPALFDDAKSQIAEASEALVAAEAELEAAQGRIDETTVLLSGLDERSEATAAEAKAASERVAQAEADLATAREELRAADAAASEQLAALDGRLDQNASELTSLSSTMEAISQQSSEAQARAAQVAQSLTATDARLTATGKDLADLVPRVGSVESAVQASDRKAQDAYNAASASSDAAQSAMENYAELKRQLDAALAESEGLYPDSSYELATRTSSTVTVVDVGARAHSGSRVAVFDRSAGAGNIFSYWEYVPVVAGHVYRIEMWARAEKGSAPMSVWVNDRDSAGATINSNSVPVSRKPLESEWARIAVEWTAPDNAAEARFFPLMDSSAPAGDIAWVDDFQVTDVTAQATLMLQVENLRGEALAAAEAAQSASIAAGKAQRSADGKTTTTYGVNPASGMGVNVGDTHRVLSTMGGGGTLLREQRWDGSSWQDAKIGHQIISSVDLGKATVGELDGLRIKAGTVATDRLLVGPGRNAVPDPYFTNAEFNRDRAAGSTGAWVPATSGGENVFTLSAPSTATVNFRYASQSVTRAIPTTGNAKWRLAVPVDARGGRARFNIRWYQASGASTYVAGSAYEVITGRTELAAAVVAPANAVAFIFDVQFPSETTARSPMVYGGGTASPLTGSVLIEDGAITAPKVNAESVAGALGQFIKVQAQNVEVTESLAARVGEFMDARTRNLIVTGDAALTGKTYIEDLAAGQAKIAKISTDQLTAGNASLDTATANRMFVDIFAGNKITGREIVVGGLPGDALADGAVGAVKIADGAVTAPKITATDEMTAKIMRAISTETAESFVRDRLVVGGAFEVLGESIVNDLNVRGTLRGRDAILTGTVDVAQLNVTEEMAAKVGRFMTLETKKAIVTESAVMQHVTAIEGIITPKITASEAKMGNLIAEKASIADIQGGNLTLTGNFRSGAVGKPGVIIPQNYTTQAGMEQLGVWLAPDGKAPSLGSEWGRTAGMWLDNASNVAGSNNSSPLFIRGQDGAGVRVMGGLSVGNSAGNALITPVGGGGNVVISARLGDADLSAGRYATLVGGSTANVITPGDLYLKGSKSIRLTDTADNPYAKSWTGGGLKTVYMGGSSGIVYTETSTARAKVDIETAKPDHEWLDMRTVTYRDRIAVELKDEIEARRAAGDCTPLTAEEHERLAISDRRVPGRIAEEGVGVADAQVVLDGSGQVEGWDYSRDAVMLTPHVREHRDKIADLEARIAELESALL